MSKFNFSKLRLQEIHGVGYRSNSNPKAISAYERYATTKWVVQRKGLFGCWETISDNEGKSYYDAKKSLEAIILDEQDRAQLLDQLTEARKKPTKTLYPPLPDVEPK